MKLSITPSIAQWAEGGEQGPPGPFFNRPGGEEDGCNVLVEL